MKTDTTAVVSSAMVTPCAYQWAADNNVTQSLHYKWLQSNHMVTDSNIYRQALKNNH
jgi:hypothetical protein